MNFKKFITGSFVTLGLIATSSVQALDLSIPRPYVVYYLDGGKASTSFSSTNTLNLVEGPHQVVVRFEGAYRDGGDTKLISSEPIVINFNADDKVSKATLKFEYPRTIAKAEKYVKNPTISIVDANDQPLDAEIFVLPHRDGLQIGRDYLKEIKELGKEYKGTPGTVTEKRVLVANANAATINDQKTLDLTDDVNAATTKTVVIVEKPEAVTTDLQNTNKNEVNKSNAATLSKLQELYNAADPETQKAFRVWLVTK